MDLIKYINNMRYEQVSGSKSYNCDLKNYLITCHACQVSCILAFQILGAVEFH